MLMALSLVEGGNDAAKESLVSSAQAYCRLLREHIQKEDDVLFRMADEVISAEEQKKLSAAFAQHEAEEMGPGVHEKYLKDRAGIGRRNRIKPIQDLWFVAPSMGGLAL